MLWMTETPDLHPTPIPLAMCVCVRLLELEWWFYIPQHAFLTR